MPSGPVVVNIVDVAGDLALTQDAFELYARKNPNRVSKFNFTKAPAPELPGKLKAMQAAGRTEIDMVLTGVGFLGNSIEQGLLVKLLPDYAAKFPNLAGNYQPPAAKMQELAQGQGIAVVFMPWGAADGVQPGQGQAAADHGAGAPRVVQGESQQADLRAAGELGAGQYVHHGPAVHPGDKDPKDPVNGWEKTWAYLKELNSCIEYYPTGTAATMKELGEGSRDMTLTMTGWDVNPRVLGIVPKDYKVMPFKGMTWINDAHYMVIPKGVPPEKVAVLLDIMAFMLTPEAQAYTWDKGYFYPGPAVKNVPLSIAPKESQDAIKEFGRPEYDKWLAEFPHTQSLEPKAQVDAYRIWDQQIGAQKTK
jgi:putative spermidine/putrescine transport system substrate-binding protein